MQTTQTTFSAFLSPVRLIQPKPPNQLFSSDTQQQSVSRAILAEDNVEKDCKLIEMEHAHVLQMMKWKKMSLPKQMERNKQTTQ